MPLEHIWINNLQPWDQFHLLLFATHGDALESYYE